jgi:hypothetical protein
MKRVSKVRVLSNPSRVLLPIESITDRAKRYRANRPEVRPPGAKVCGYCASKRNVGVDHINGFEEDCTPQNLIWACKSCNGIKAHLFKKNGLGRRVKQYNPAKKTAGHSRVSLAEYGAAIKVMRGVFDGDVSKAMETIRNASPSIRSAYTSRTWAARRALYGPTGRTPVQSEIPF